MITRFVVTMVGAAAVGFSPLTSGAELTPKNAGARSVAEMLQNRQQNQLRQRLLDEGRLDEVRALDELNATRERERQNKALTQLNQGMVRGSGSTSQTNATLSGDSCDRETLRTGRLN